MPQRNPRIIDAAAVWPVTGPPITRARIEIDDRGVIQTVAPRPATAPPASWFLPDSCIVVPGFINAHTHLELTLLRDAIAQDEFFEWVQALRRRKAELSAESFDEAARQGVREFWSQGVSCVADTGDTGAAARALSQLGGRGIAYQEIFGPDPAQADPVIESLPGMLAEQSDQASDTVEIGVSPHAPYSVSASLYRKVAAIVRQRNLRCAVHVAESQSEWDLVTAGTGPFAAMWQARGIPEIEPAASPIALLARSEVLAPGLLAIHCVRLSDDDITALQRSNTSVVVCPRSNARHGHGLPRIEAMLAAGLPVALGTDSAASVADIDIREDARYLVDRTMVSGERAVRMFTIDAAEALRLAERIGSVEAGKDADLVVLELSDRATATGDRPWDLVLDPRTKVAATLVKGRPRYVSADLSRALSR